MIVRSQNGKHLLYSDHIYVSGTFILSEGRTMNHKLGEYSSEEKAMKVMEIIHNHIECFNVSKKVFQMPQDSEVE